MIEKKSLGENGFLRALSIQNFTLLQFSRLFSFCAYAMERAATGWLILKLTDSVFLLALKGTLMMLPALIFGAFVGVVADRVDRRKLVVATQVVSALLQLSMGLIVALRLVRFWHIALISFALGTVNAIDWPARMAMITDVVGYDLTYSGLSIDNLAGYLMVLVGPVIGGWMIGSAGFFPCYIVISLLYLVGATAMIKIHNLGRKSPPKNGSLIKDVVDGFSYSKKNSKIKGVLLITVIMNIFGFTYGQLMPIFARDILNTGPEGYGLLAGISGLGATIALLTILISGGIKRVELAFTISTLSMASIAISFSLSRWFILSLLLRMIAGFCQAYFEIGQYGIPLSHSTGETRGRIMAILNIAMMGMIPIGSMEIGVLASSLGADYATLLNGSAALVLSALTFASFPSIRKSDYSPND